MSRDPFQLYRRKGVGTVQKRSISEIDATTAGDIGIRSPEDRYPWRILLTVMVCVFGVLCIRLVQLQVIEGKRYASASEGNRVESERIQPLRGIITDRTGTPLVQNISNFELILDGSRINSKTDSTQSLFGELRETLDLSDEELNIFFTTALEKKIEVVVKDEIIYEDALKLMSLTRNSRVFKVQTAYRRQYMYGPLLSHVLGYEGTISEEEYAVLRQDGYGMTDKVGKTGIEQVYEKELRGVPGVKRYEVDNRGHLQSVLSTTTPESGKQLELGIDLGLQQRLYDAVKNMVDSKQLPGGSAIALDPRTGVVRALVSYPSYDNNDFDGGISQEVYAAYNTNPQLPLFHRAMSGQYPSGSVFKPVVAAAALDVGIVTPSTTVMSVGGIEVGGSSFPDWKAGGHGLTNVYKAIADSVNTYFYMVGGGSFDGTFKGLGPYRIVEYAKKFGLGSRTGIDLPGEAKGFVPTPEWKEEFKNEQWFLGDTYHFAIGQGDLLVTPLQVANYTAAIANGGTLYEPRLVEAFIAVDTAVRTEVEPTVLNAQVAPTNVVNVVRDAMRQNVVSGSGRALASLPVSAGGKTGTAQYDNNTKAHAWFTSFAPYENPELALTVMLEAGVEGSSTAVPVAKEVLQYYFSR